MEFSLIVYIDYIKNMLLYLVVYLYILGQVKIPNGTIICLMY